MGENQTTNEIIQYVDREFLLSAYAHNRVIMEDAGFGINGGVVLFIPNPNKVEAVIHDFEQCGGVRGQIRGSKIPSASNYTLLLITCQPHYKPDLILEFLTRTDYTPVFVVCGMMPEWLNEYPNILLLEVEEIDTDYVNKRVECLNDFFEFSHSHARDLIKIMNSIRDSEQFRDISDEISLYKSLYCIGVIYNYYIHMKYKGLQVPSDYYDCLDSTIRDALEFDDIDMETISSVYKALCRYLDTETDILIGSTDKIEGDLIEAVAEKRAILYDEKYYYLTENLFNDAVEEELDFGISQRLLKLILYQEGVLICNNTRSNYSIKKLLTSAYGESLRMRFLKFSREKLEEGQQLSLVERRQTYVSGKM